MSIIDHQQQDVTAGFDWKMDDADSVRFLWVSRTIAIGEARVQYDFTLVEYKLHIEEVPWTFFSTLGNALETEFDEHFWTLINYKRKGRPEFVDIPWFEDRAEYDVSPACMDLRLSIFNSSGRTLKVVCPFKWYHTYLKVHPNGAAIYTDNKKFEFLLPWIVLTHDLLPPTPLFWVQEEQGLRTISICRESLWLHENTIAWLAETNESFPPELHDVITQRLQKRGKSGSQAKYPNQTQASKGVRWEKRSGTATDAQEGQSRPVPAAQASQPAADSLQDRDEMYIRMQATFQAMQAQYHDNNAVSPPVTEQKPTEAAAAASDAKDNAENQAPAASPQGASAPSNAAANAAAVAANPQAEPSQKDLQLPKIGAQKLAGVRPETPPAPKASEPSEPKEVTPETGVLSSAESNNAAPTQPDNQGAQRRHEAAFNIPMKLSPTEPPLCSHHK
jgi:hypothetical protein